MYYCMYQRILWIARLSMFAVKAKTQGVPIINPALSLMMKHLVIGRRKKKS